MKNPNLTNVDFKKSFKGQSIAVCMVFMLLPYIHVAQDELPHHYKTYNMTIKSEGVQSKSNPEVITRTVSEKGATWLRLFFKEVNLGNKSTLTIVSALDGASQTLTSSTIQDWKNTSAYFNGDKVTLTLVVAAGEKSVGLDIWEIAVGKPDLVAKSRCGFVDNRRDSNDAAIGRIVPSRCTGWIITNGKLVTAGHCAGDTSEIIEFNVPKSNANSSLVHPGPEDQYPIGDFVTEYIRGQPETDWAVFTVNPNSQTRLTPIQAQGKSFDVVQSEPGGEITITGFGIDTGNDNRTQQTHTGPLTSLGSIVIKYRTDTTAGNSGSPIIDAATGNAVGVHTSGGCWRPRGSNSGRRATIPAFWDAMGLDGTSPLSMDTCITFNFNDFKVSSFSNLDSVGDFSIQNGGNSLSLENNTWKYITLDYTVTSNTVLEFDFSSTGEGEIHGVGFENDNSLTSSRYFRVYGTQNYGVGNFDNYSGSGTTKYTIPMANFYAGNMDRLVFINDNDAGSGNTSVFSNVKVYEGSCGSSATAESLIAELESASTILGNEEEGDLAGLKITPNPAKNSFSLHLSPYAKGEVIATVYTILGREKGQIKLAPGVNTISTYSLSLTSGIYLVRFDSNAGESTTQKLIVN